MTSQASRASSPQNVSDEFGFPCSGPLPQLRWKSLGIEEGAAKRSRDKAHLRNVNRHFIFLNSLRGQRHPVRWRHRSCKPPNLSSIPQAGRRLVGSPLNFVAAGQRRSVRWVRQNDLYATQRVERRHSERPRRYLARPCGRTRLGILVFGFPARQDGADFSKDTAACLPSTATDHVRAVG